ncbi:hypothetical protein AJ78_06369 [Emergomyces pasteurianus Ep9510]|uniref:Uncharacterized protein n=1 Tax=Emergomyces pasteurianus Ep9510 TaxID=1447872 RepID=A0A1J9PB11_9EURO|nr:hypothetical protein AJ78_06369 [Emergomyces pasteurianus Ep9510]
MHDTGTCSVQDTLANDESESNEPTLNNASALNPRKALLRGFITLSDAEAEEDMRAELQNSMHKRGLVSIPSY